MSARAPATSPAPPIRATRNPCHTDYMANLTITVDDETLKRARMKAIERGESVNRYLARQLLEYADGDVADRRARAARAFVAFAQSHGGSSDGAGWVHEDLYDDEARGTLR